MKYRQETVREGEKLGPIDWAYDFYKETCINADLIPAMIERFRQIETGEWEATTDGGWPKVGWGKVLDTGMYDGWPYWKPVPSFLLSSWAGASWHPWHSLTEARSLVPVDPPPHFHPCDNCSRPVECEDGCDEEIPTIVECPYCRNME